MKLFMPCIGLLLLSSCASNNDKEIEGSNWRGQNPKQAIIGSYGIVAMGSNSKMGFTRHGFLSEANVSVMKTKSKTIKYESKNKSEAALNISDLAALGITREQSYTSGFTALEVSIKSPNDLVKLINADIKKNNALKWNTDSIRVVTSILIANGYESNYSSSNKIKIEGEQIKKDVIGSFQHNYNVDRENGAIIAYKYSRLCWENEINGKLVYIQEEFPNSPSTFWTDAFDCPSTTIETRMVE